MSEGVEYGQCEICKKEGPVSRTYYRYNIKCRCHSPNHFELVTHCLACTPIEPRFTLVRHPIFTSPTVVSTDMLKDVKSDGGIIQGVRIIGLYDYNTHLISVNSIVYRTFSVGIFKWVAARSGRLKKGRSEVRVSGLVKNKENVFKVVSEVRSKLQAGTWSGPKTVKVKC